MKSWKSLLWGVVLIAIGVVIGLNALDIVSVNLFFDGWWTLFILVPSAIGLIGEKRKTGPLIGLLLGVLLLLVAQGIIPFRVLWKLTLPAVLVIIGLALIVRNVGGSNVKEKIRNLNRQAGEKQEYCAIFGGRDVNFNGQTPDAASVCAVFGGVKCDLRHAVFPKETVLNVSAIFGGVDILVPPTVNVVVQCIPVFGGVSDKTSASADPSLPTLYIHATCMFGGVDIT